MYVYGWKVKLNQINSQNINVHIWIKVENTWVIVFHYYTWALFLPYLYFTKVLLKMNIQVLLTTFPIQKKSFYSLHFFRLQSTCYKSRRSLLLSSSQWPYAIHQSNGFSLESNQVHQCRKKNYQESSICPLQ